MSDIINCPSCHRKLQVPEALIGQDVQCPSCGATFEAKGNPEPLLRPPELEPPKKEQPAADRHDRSTCNDDYDEDDNDDTDNQDPAERRRSRMDLEPHRGTLILVLGILSLVLGGLLGVGFALGPIAWIMGNNDLAAIRAGRMDREGEGLTNAGRICGIISTILLGFTLVACLLLCMGALGGFGGRGNPRRF
jgi:hypothetical protein